VQCDANITRIDVYESWQQPENKNTPEKLVGRGGTKFEPVFEWVNHHLIPSEGTPDILAYLTDGYGSFPRRVPAYPVYWIVPEKRKVNVPFGATIEVAEV
jgi:predicted metal-dependent peptidase